MKNALILHGTNNNSSGNWFQWLKRELETEEMGFKEVWVPDLPNSDKPDFETYWNHIKDFNFNEKTILIGHSSGATAILGILNRLPDDQKIKLAILVSGFIKDEGWNCEGLFKEEFDWNKIKKQANHIELLWSEDDPYISLEQTEQLSDNLKIEPIVYKDWGHFNLESSKEFWKFPELLKIIISNDYYPCPICGYRNLSYKADDPNLYSSYDICSCCGIEFGYEIMSYDIVKIKELREQWLNKDALFFSSELRPHNWSKEKALKQIQSLPK